MTERTYRAWISDALTMSERKRVKDLQALRVEWERVIAETQEVDLMWADAKDIPWERVLEQGDAVGYGF